MFESILKAIDDHLLPFVILCLAIGWALKVIFLKKDPDADDDDHRDLLIEFEDWRCDRPRIREKHSSEEIVDQFLDQQSE